MKLRICVSVVAAVAALTLTSACGSSDSDKSGSAANPDFGACKPTTERGSIDLKTVKNATLTVGTVLPLPPLFIGDTPRSVKDGYEYCIAADIANAAGLNSVTVKNVAFDQVIAGKMDGLDMLMAGIFVNPEREKVLDFSIPYFRTDQGVMVKTGSKWTKDNIADARFGVLGGTAAEDLVTDDIGAKPPATFGSLPEVRTALLAGRIDAMVSDSTEVLIQMKQSDGKFEVIGQVTNPYGDNAIVFPKGSPNVDPVNEILKPLLADGTIPDLIAKYLNPELAKPIADVPTWKF